VLVTVNVGELVNGSVDWSKVEIGVVVVVVSM
jgi:hypothetical protein